MSTVEESDDGRVDVPNLVRLMARIPTRGFGGWTRLRGRRQRCFRDGKPASGDVSVFLRAHHLPDGLTLVGSDLLRSGLWTRGDVVDVYTLHHVATSDI